MLPYLAIVVAFVGFCNSAPQNTQRGCNAKELQNLLDCMLLDQKNELKAVDSAIAKCISVNKCSFGDLWAPIDVSTDNTEAPIAENEINVSDREELPPSDPVPENTNPYSQFSWEIMDMCFQQSEAYMLTKVQPDIINCVKNTNKPLLQDFDYPKFPHDYLTSDPNKENQPPSGSCQRESLDACANGRYQAVDRDMCSLQMTCMHTCKNCNFTLTTKSLCSCANEVIRSKFNDIKKNFSDCLLSNSMDKSLQLNIPKEMDDAEIEGRVSMYCITCSEKAVQPCGKEDLENLARCVVGESDAVRECYRSTNCPMGKDNDKKQQEISNPFEKFTNQTAVAYCSESVFNALADDVKTCIQTRVPNFEYPDIDIGEEGDNDDVSYGNSGPKGKSPSGGCNKAALNVCLEGRLFKDTDDMCKRETICAKRHLTCDLEATKKAACNCAQNEMNTKFDEMKTQMYNCLGIKDQTKYQISKQQRQQLDNQVNEIFCSCTSGGH